MPKGLTVILCQVYLAVALCAGAAVFPAEGTYYFILAGAPAAALILFIALRPTPRYQIVLDVFLIFLVPVALSVPLEKLAYFTPLTGRVTAFVLSLPAFYLLDYHLKENARRWDSFSTSSGKRRPTHVFFSLAAAAPIMLLIALAAQRPILIFAGVALMLYLLGALALAVWRIPHTVFSVKAIPKRLVAGTADDIFFELNNKADVPLYASLNSAVSWMQVTPRQALLNKGVNRFSLSLKPPLAGQAKPRIKILAMDARGIFYVSENIEPVELHVIPRGEYAAWLARKYLDQHYADSSPLADMTAKNRLNAKLGTEYQDSRDYRPGDLLRNIDWKHTLKLSQLIVREYEEAGEQGAIIAVNLTAGDEEAADMLAFYLITTALTLAREEIPTALTAYNHRDVINSTHILEPGAALAQTLALTDEISIEKFSDRRLEPVDIAKIRRTIKQLRQVKTKPAQRLLDLLDFEHKFTEEGARQHPATRALTTVTRDTPAPAMIFVISQFNHDTEAILVNTEKLAARNYNVVPIASA
jgi:hypothetical protein